MYNVKNEKVKTRQATWSCDHDLVVQVYFDPLFKPTLVGWFFGFNGISTFVHYLMPNPFLYK